MINGTAIVGSDNGSFSAYMREMRKIAFLTPELERELMLRVFDDRDKYAAQQIVTAYLPFVVKIAMRFRSYTASMMDMISEGNIGLLKAVSKFNPYTGYAFATYARWWIQASIQDYIASTCMIVTGGIKKAKVKLFGNTKRLMEKIEECHNKVESSRLICFNDDNNIDDNNIDDNNFIEGRRKKNSNMNHKKKSDIQSEKNELLHYELMSSSALMLSDRNGDNQIIEDGLKGGDEYVPENEIMRSENRRWQIDLLHQALSRLSERELNIFSKRYMRNPSCSLSELAKAHAVSTERIRQIEHRAMDKVKKYIATHLIG